MRMLIGNEREGIRDGDARGRRVWLSLCSHAMRSDNWMKMEWRTWTFGNGNKGWRCWGRCLWFSFCSHPMSNENLKDLEWRTWTFGNRNKVWRCWGMSQRLSLCHHPTRNDCRWNEGFECLGMGIRYGGVGERACGTISLCSRPTRNECRWNEEL